MLWNSRWFPGTNLQDINLDWILKKVSALRGGRTGQYLYKKSDKDFDFGWKTGGGGGGTSDYLDLDNKPSINNVELSGNKTAADLGLATPSDIPTVPVQIVNGQTGAVNLTASDVGAYAIPEEGIPKTDLASDVQTSLNNANTALQAVPAAYRTSAAQDAIDAAQNADIGTRAKADEIAIVITGARPALAVSVGQYVTVRNSTISGISDGLYTANSALSPSTDVTAANLTAVNGGGLNSLQNNVFQYTEYTLTKESSATNWTIIRYHACKLGKIAFLQIVASVTAAQDSSGVRIFALPQDLRPRYGIETRVTSAEFAMDVNVNITVEGNMAFTRGGSTAGNIRMDFCYPTN